MEAEVKDSFLDYFGEIEDPRSSRNQLHMLSEILFAVFCAYIGGSDGWEDVELFGKTHENFLKRYFPYKNGVPSDDTYRRLFRALDPGVFQEKFRSWVLENSPKFVDGVIAIDGKASHGSEDGVGEDKHVLHMVSAYSTETNIVLAQEKVSDKSNEITAIPQLLEWLDLRGSTVTIDAMGCQYKIADQIVDKDGDYILALKSNHPDLFADVEIIFRDSETMRECESFETIEKEHGRIETRKCLVLNDVAWLRDMHPQWKTIKAVVRVDSKREIKGKISEESRYYIASRNESAKKTLAKIRSHWAIENSLHWVLDMSFGEDQAKIRKGNAPQNIAILRHLALNLLKMAKTNSVHYKRVSSLVATLNAMRSEAVSFRGSSQAAAGTFAGGVVSLPECDALVSLNQATELAKLLLSEAERSR